MTADWGKVLTGAAPVTAFATLVCCALPFALVAVGAGSVVAAVATEAPWLAWLSIHKMLVFVVAGVTLAADYWALYRSGRVCEVGGRCHPAHPVGRWMYRVYWASVVTYTLGFFFAYLAAPLALRLGL